ncbi:MAG: aspartate kinase, partial [Proteobacteria bacterium]|nr:aspartate kinase [Pseudomonadota bacterium]
MSDIKPIVILKFGGTSVSNLERWKQVLKIINLRLKQGFRVAIVHSAKSGLTNLLESFSVTKEKQYINEISDSVVTLATDLGVEFDPSKSIKQLDNYSDKDQLSTYDIAHILSLGETMTNELAYLYLSQHLDIEKLNPKNLFISSADDDRSQDSRILSAKCSIKTAQLNKDCAIMPGFIAADSDNNTIVLGRGGSDTSAAYLAVAFNAQRVEIWTDVHGIFSANPHVIPTARLIEKIGYEEAREIAASGGKVLHPRCILPAEENNIPIHIYNSKDLQATGTVIQKGYESTSP